MTDGDSISRYYTIQQIQKAKESNYNFNYDTLIDFIKVLPSIEKADGDSISKQAVIGIVEFECGEWKGLARTIVKAIEQLPSTEKTANKININEYVKVKLTDYGKEIFYHQYDSINKTYGKEIIKPRFPTVDSDGYTSFQLWYFMNLYGRYIDMGMQNVIEPLEIVFESVEKTTEWNYEKFGYRTCSKCGYSNVGIDDDGVFIPNNYCPNCGSKMKEGEEE